MSRRKRITRLILVALPLVLTLVVYRGFGPVAAVAPGAIATGLGQIPTAQPSATQGAKQDEAPFIYFGTIPRDFNESGLVTARLFVADAEEALEVVDVTVERSDVSALIAPVDAPPPIRRVAMLFDSSSSLEFTDPFSLRSSAAQLLINDLLTFEGELPPPDQMAVVTFPNPGGSINQVTRIQTPFTNNRLSLVNSVNNFGLLPGTPLYQAIYETLMYTFDAADVMTDFSIVIVLTDGEPTGNPLNIMEGDVIDLAVELGLPVITFGLGPATAPNNPARLTLENIARESGGIYGAARGPQDLIPLFDSFSVLITGDSVLLNVFFDPIPGPQTRVRLPVTTSRGVFEFTDQVEPDGETFEIVDVDEQFFSVPFEVRSAFEEIVIGTYTGDRVREGRNLLSDRYSVVRNLLEVLGATVVPISQISASTLFDVDILVTGMHDGSFTQAEEQALADWMQDENGNLLAFSERWDFAEGLNAITEPFGLVGTGEDRVDTSTLVDPASTIANGPFGMINNLERPYLPQLPGAFDTTQLGISVSMVPGVELPESPWEPLPPEAFAIENTSATANLVAVTAEGEPAIVQLQVPALMDEPSCGGRAVFFNDVNFFDNDRIDFGGNFAAFFNSFSWLLERFEVRVPATIALAEEQADHVNSLPVEFEVTFAERMIDFDNDDTDDVDVIFIGSTEVTDYDVEGDGFTYTITVNETAGDGTVHPIIPKHAALRFVCFGSNDFAEGPAVLYDTKPTEVTFQRAPGQPLITNELPIVFNAHFDDNVTNFDNDNTDDFDVRFVGSTDIVDFSVIGIDQEYQIVVHDVSGDGTVEGFVPRSVTIDSVGNSNLKSVNTDNIVLYDGTRPVSTLELAFGQTNLTNQLPIVFEVLYSERVDLFNATSHGTPAVEFTGSAGGIEYHIEPMTEFDSPLKNGDFETGNFDHWHTVSTDGASGGFFVHSNAGLTPLRTHTSVGPASGSHFAISDQTSPGGAVLTQSIETYYGLHTQTLLHVDLFVDSPATGPVARVNGGIDSDAVPNQYGVVDLLEPGADLFTNSVGILQSLYLDVDDGNRPVPYTRRTYDITSVVEETQGRFVLRFGQVATQSVPGVNGAVYMSMGVDRVQLENVFEGLHRKYRIVVTDVARDGAVIPTLPEGAAVDLASNVSFGYTSPSRSVVYDSNPPRITLGAPSLFETAEGPVSYRITYEGTSSISLTAADVEVVSTGTAAGTVTVTGEGETTRLITFSDLSGTGTLGFRLAGGTAVDGAGNEALATGTSVTFSVDPGLEPVLRASPPTLDFGATPLGRHTDRTITVTNDGPVLLPGNASADAPFSVVAGSPWELGSGQSVEVIVRYTPTALGSAEGMATLTGGGGATIPLTADGIPADSSQIAVSPGEWRFGAIEPGASRTAGFRVTNTGTDTLDGSVMVAQGFIAGDGSPYSIEPGASTIVNVRFAPGAAGDFDDDLIFTGGGNARVHVTGQGRDIVGSIAGRVRDAASSAIDQAGLGLISGDEFLRGTAVDHEGRYAFANVPAGVYRIGVYAPGYISELRTVEIESSSEITENFTLQPRTGEPEVSGTGNIGGIPIDIVVNDEVVTTTVTAGDGTYAIDLDIAGEVTIAVHAPGYQSQTDTLTVSSGVPLVFNPVLNTPTVETGELSGRVLNATTSAGIGGATVVAEMDGAVYRTEAGGTGDFSFASLPTGPVVLNATAEGFERTESISMTHFGAGTELVELMLSPLQMGGEGEGESEPTPGCGAGPASGPMKLSDVFTVFCVVVLLYSRRRRASGT